MIDIVERLERISRSGARECYEAAMEIKRLRREVEQLKDLVEGYKRLVRNA